MKNKINKILDKLEIGSLISYEWLGNGFNSHAYNIETTKGNYVLLESKINGYENTKYKEYFATLKCLEHKNYINAPRAIFVSNDGKKLLITRSFSTEITKLKKLTDSDIKKVAINLTDALLELKNIKYEDLLEEFKKIGLDKPKTFTLDSDWETYAVKPFIKFKTIAPKDAHTSWIEEQISLHVPYNSKSSNLSFRHGDTSGPNVLVNKNLSITLLDWGSSKFYYTSINNNDYGISYVMNHIDVISKMKDYILNYIAKKEDIKFAELNKHVLNLQKHIKISDISWAYMMYIRAKAGEINDKPKIFKNILDKRINDYKKQFLN